LARRSYSSQFWIFYDSFFILELGARAGQQTDGQTRHVLRPIRTATQQSRHWNRKTNGKAVTAKFMSGGCSSRGYESRNCCQRRSEEFDLGGYKLHDIEFVLGQGDKTTT